MAKQNTEFIAGMVVGSLVGLGAWALITTLSQQRQVKLPGAMQSPARKYHRVRSATPPKRTRGLWP